MGYGRRGNTGDGYGWAWNVIDLFSLWVGKEGFIFTEPKYLGRLLLCLSSCGYTITGEGEISLICLTGWPLKLTAAVLSILIDCPVLGISFEEWSLLSALELAGFYRLL